MDGFKRSEDHVDAAFARSASAILSFIVRINTTIT